MISPVLSNLYLTEVDRRLERAKETTREGQYTFVEYARFADDLVTLVDAHRRHDWRLGAVEKRLREELGKLGVEINEEKSRLVELAKGESCGFLRFDFRRIRSRRGVWRPHYTPKLKRRTAVVRTLKEVFRRGHSQPVARIVTEITPILRGWVTYFRIGYAGRCFAFIRQWVETKLRRHLRRAKKLQASGGKKRVCGGCTRNSGALTTTEFIGPSCRRKCSSVARSHNPWCETHRKAQCGKSACCV